MKELYVKGVADHDDPESCGVIREGGGEALTGAHMGWVSSREMFIVRGADAVEKCGRQHGGQRHGEPSTGPAWSETPCTCGTYLHGNREIPCPPDGVAAGPQREGVGRTPLTHGQGKSDPPIVPEKLPNKAGIPAAEAVEGRGGAKGTAAQQSTRRTQSRGSVSQALDCVRLAARRDRKARFTALLHHLTPDLLHWAFHQLKRQAAPGIDGVTWQTYEAGLAGHIEDLHGRVMRGAYRAMPSRRQYIPKPDGRQRPLGIAALEDKIVQRGVVEILNAIYETDFRGFSYGFRPGRSQHDALDALAVGICRRKVNWILDADIRAFFDSIDHTWMMRFLEHRIGDRRVLRLIGKWLTAGVMEDGTWTKGTVGTPQGAVISPLLANLYLHHVYDLWVERWRRHEARGDMIVVRYADDTIVGFQHRADADRFLRDLRDRLAKFALDLHPDKTRLLEFGRFAAVNRARRGDRRPETFDFLGFTHICATAKSGGFLLMRHTMRKRL